MLFLLLACAAAVYLWHHAPALLLLIGSLGLLWYVVIPLAIMLVCGLGLVLIWGSIWSIECLSWLAKALPACWLFDGPPPNVAQPAVLTPEVVDLRVDRARRALHACTLR